MKERIHKQKNSNARSVISFGTFFMPASAKQQQQDKFAIFFKPRCNFSDFFMFRFYSELNTDAFTFSTKDLDAIRYSEHVLTIKAIDVVSQF